MIHGCRCVVYLVNLLKDGVKNSIFLFIFTIDKRKKVCYNAAARLRAEISIIPYPADFVNRHFAQKFCVFYPKILYFAQKKKIIGIINKNFLLLLCNLSIVFLGGVWYHNNCQGGMVRRMRPRYHLHSKVSKT